MFAAPFVASSYEKSPPQAHHRLITGHLRHNHSMKIMFYSLHIHKCNYIITKKYLYYSINNLQRKAVERVLDVLLKMIKIIRDLIRVLRSECIQIFLD